MSRRLSSLLAMVLGVMALRLIFTGEYLNYVKRSMFIWLLLSAAVLLVMGALGWWTALKETGSHDEHGDGCGHGHGHSLSRAAWLLLLPILAVGLAQPAPLGAFAANRQQVRPPQQGGDVEELVKRFSAQNAAAAGALQAGDSPVPPVAPQAGTVDPPPVAPQAGTVDPPPAPPQVAGLPVPQPGPGEAGEMNLLDFLEITYYDDSGALEGMSIRLEGFVVRVAGRNDQFLLSRFMINCCAADASLLQAGIAGVSGGIPPEDTWVSVTGRWNPEGRNSKLTPDGFPIPELVAEKVEEIPAPENPYLTLADLW